MLFNHESTNVKILIDGHMFEIEQVRARVLKYGDEARRLLDIIVTPLKSYVFHFLVNL